MARKSGATIIPAALCIAVEGATDFSFGRPLDCCLYSRSEAKSAWEAWRFGWLEASWLNEMRGNDARRRWQVAA